MDPIHDLRCVLQRMLTCYEALRDVKLAEREAVLEVDLDTLEACNRRQDRIHVDVAILEQKRRVAVEDLARRWDAEPDTLTVSEICRRLEAGQLGQLERISARLTEIVKELDELNTGNREMIQQSLVFVREAIRAFSGAMDEGDAYTHKGRAGASPGGPMLLDKTV